MKCRHCEEEIETTFIDLGHAPISNSYLCKNHLSLPEIYYPLRVLVCNSCWLVQTQDFVSPKQMFTENYAYLSSASKSWLIHSKKYVEHISNLLTLNQDSKVFEIASNDGYLLQFFLEKGIPSIGIEPTASTAKISMERGINTIQEFFSEKLAIDLASKNDLADLIIGNNVYAHVPDINDFTLGMKRLLRKNGVITLEFPHLLNLIKNKQFDTIYHEHFSYLSLHAVIKIFSSADLRIWHVEELSTHGGSLRVYGCHNDDQRDTLMSVAKILQKESDYSLTKIDTYLNFQDSVNEIKNNFLTFLIDEKRKGKTFAAFGAAAKGNTLLNYAGIKSDLIPFVVDSSQLKQNKYLPGSHIPIYSLDFLPTTGVDYILVFPWNLIDEAKLQFFKHLQNGSKLVTFVPELQIHE